MLPQRQRCNYFYPRSPCGERRDRLRSRPGFSDFYPRSPCGERLSSFSAFASAPVFLSTLSLRRATSTSLPQQGQRTKFLSTLSLRRATGDLVHLSALDGISIHALLAESDTETIRKTARPYVFLSTLSLRRATGMGIELFEGFKSISIHALLAESDTTATAAWTADSHFYPRSPCGERRNTARRLHCLYLFLSTLSLRRATAFVILYTVPLHQFLSTLSLRRATAYFFLCAKANRFLSTLSLRRATRSGDAHAGRNRNFYPRSPCGERQAQSRQPGSRL